MGDIPVLTQILSVKQARELNPLVLAYIGDGAHTLYVRIEELKKTTGKADKLHIAVTARVNAAAQAKSMEAIRPLLNEEEESIFLRARNSRQHSVAKNASIADYKTATGFEAVIGFLYLTGQSERLEFLLRQDRAVVDADNQ
ncbi:MAG: Mini-ribonuclease 3 [Clostridia bacterium]|nr:Mini-ribonuclease 3 [Clostridia bacterium]MDE7215552.1 Mini-ribonuclease 3 [Clostridia bacterium]MDE7337469.1 Mini-ribonuclease 3 [Clostridia bacterium]